MAHLSISIEVEVEDGALPLPAAIFNDLISAFCAQPVVQCTGGGNDGKCCHLPPPPQWGTKKNSPRSWTTQFPAPPSWKVSSKVVAQEMMPVGRSDSREDVLQTSVPPMSHSYLRKGSPSSPEMSEFVFSISIGKHLSLTSPTLLH